jgi:DDE_Tnp_1-associated/Transposase DDE domain
MSAPLSLVDVFTTIPDPRSPRGKVYPLTAVLNLLAVAMLAGMRSLEAVAQFGREHGRPLAHALGFRSHKTPCKASLSNLLRRLDVTALERALARWVQARCPDLGDTLAIDGKALRGSATYQLPGVHLLAAYAPRVGAVVAQVRVSNKTNEHKAALELLGVLPLAGKVVTGDAMFCHADVCEAVLEGGGDYLWTVKDNQPRLHFDIAALFAEAAAFSPLPTGAFPGGTR